MHYYEEKNYVFKLIFCRNNLLSSFWKAKLPYKVKIIIWIVVLNKINSNDLLQTRRPHKTVPPNICVLCHQNVES